MRSVLFKKMLKNTILGAKLGGEQNASVRHQLHLTYVIIGGTLINAEIRIPFPPRSFAHPPRPGISQRPLLPCDLLFWPQGSFLLRMS